MPPKLFVYILTSLKWIISSSVKALAPSGSLLAAVLSQSNPKAGSVPNQERATKVVTKSDILETQPGVFRDAAEDDELQQWSCAPRKLSVTH